MERPCRIKIESKIENLDGAGLASGDIERTEQELEGNFSLTDGGFALRYSEKSEGGEIFSEVSADGELVRVARRGAIESTFDFKVGVSHSSLYSMGQYSFDVSIMPRRVDVKLDRDSGFVDLLYNMNIGGQDKAVRMKIWMQMN